MAKCLLCGKTMATVKVQVNRKGEPVKYGLRYSCVNKRCKDYGEQNVRKGYPSDKRVAELHKHKVLPYKIKK